MHFDGSVKHGHGGHAFVYDIHGTSSKPVHVQKSGITREEDHTTSTKEEFVGMARGMQSLHDTVASLGSPKHVHVKVCGDSKNAVDAMHHCHVPKDPHLQKLQSQTERWASDFESVEYKKVSRAQNKEAHKLASAAAGASLK